MSLLVIISLVNCALMLIFFAMRRFTGLSYMEMIVARKIATYFLTFTALVIVGLLLLKKTAAAQITGYTVNLLLAAIMVLYFIRILQRIK